MNQRLYSKGKENFKGLECENTGVQGYMTHFSFSHWDQITYIHLSILFNSGCVYYSMSYRLKIKFLELYGWQHSDKTIPGSTKGGKMWFKLHGVNLEGN